MYVCICVYVRGHVEMNVVGVGCVINPFLDEVLQRSYWAVGSLFPFLYCNFLLRVDRPVVGSVSLIIKANAKV